jgi:hypothetical protein
MTVLDLKKGADGVFRYVDEPHGYWLGDRQLDSPSSVFAELGLVDKRHYTEASRARGRAVHAGLHFAIKGTLDWNTLHPELHGYVRSGLLWVERRKPTILRLETPLYHPALLFAGTMDAEWELDGWPWVVDWKSGKAPRLTKYQTAGYAMLAARPGQKRPHKRAAFELFEDGSIANLVPYDDHTDGAGWLNLLGASRIRQQLRAPQLEVNI